ncbi:uncharacterized protein LOC124154347 [Ischnura elegans]|uniref:uncharacterized protein LOC124154347 n=1 Tax=Ischnura elegans TaxID=197161 RepID=UPI001ED883B9|nr:uncharacterized protein LOC124154347 [Ischnura elegans]
MHSLLVTVIVAACVTLPALGFYVPRDDDTIEHQQCMNRSHMASVDLSRCMMRVLESGGNPDELYPDSPCPRCSHVCSKRDEVQECSRRYANNVIEIMVSHRVLELSRFMDQLFESALSLFCRPDIIQFMSDSEKTTYASQKLKACSPIMIIGSPDDLCNVRETPMPGFERNICRYLVKVAQCVETRVKTEKPELEEILTAVINGIKDSDACGIHLQEIVDSEGD